VAHWQVPRRSLAFGWALYFLVAWHSRTVDQEYAMQKHSLIWVVIFSVIVLMFLRLPPMVAKEDSVLSTYHALVEVDALAKQHYVEQIEGDDLVDGAIRGMMFQLDPYSGYIAPRELERFKRRHMGAYIGIGIEVGMLQGRPTVIAAIEGGPAAQAGVLAGDRITAINGRNVKGLSAFDIELWLEGQLNTDVRLTVQRGTEPKESPMELTIARGPVSVTTVRGFRRDSADNWEYMLDPNAGIGYVRISSFQKGTTRDLDTVLHELIADGLAGLIIDLRFNPGGLLDQAVATVDLFVDTGLIASTVTRRRAVRQYLSTSQPPATDVKLAVLINGGTASAAEIVSGSLQDHKRALVVGERSFGKGSVQRVMYLTSHPAAVKLTVAYYRLPSGRIIHRTFNDKPNDSWGVQPGVVVTLADEEVQAVQRSRRALDMLTAEGAASLELPGQEARIRESAGVEIVRDRQLVEAMLQLSSQIDGAHTSRK
jgi:carboxyl-terminal processing protease